MGATTYGIMTLSIISLRIISLGEMTFCTITLNNMTLGVMKLIIIPLSKKTCDNVWQAFKDIPTFPRPLHLLACLDNKTFPLVRLITLKLEQLEEI